MMGRCPMKLVLPIPADWRQRTVAEGVLYQSPARVFGLLVMPFDAAPEDPDNWVQRALLHREPDGQEPRNVRLSRLTTDSGWAAILLDGEVGTEARMVAYFAFLDYAATVIAICRDPAAMPSWRHDALAILMKVRPDFSQEGVVSLAKQLGSPPPTSVSRPLDARGAVSTWRRSFSGSDVVFTTEEGPAAGRIRIVQRKTPVRPAEEIFAPWLSGVEPGDMVERPTISVTAEGEYAAFANAIGRRRQHTLGIVFGDDHYAEIEGVTTVADQFGRFRIAVQKLTYAYTLGLGSNRWRRFYYEAPPGWIGVARTRATVWIAPSCPRQYQVMKVFDARPPSDNLAARQGARIFETLPHEFFREPSSVPFIFFTPAGLQCRVIVFTGQVPNRRSPIKAIEGTVMEARYIYPIRMECDAELLAETMHVFERVIGSIRPFPERGPDLDPDMGVLTSWVD
jgi:hypothetical protein